MSERKDTPHRGAAAEPEGEFELSLADVCKVCGVSEEIVCEFVEEGVVEPTGAEPARWRFHSISIRRIRRAHRLEQDLGVNAAGAALALDLLDELEQLRNRLRKIEIGADGDRG